MVPKDLDLRRDGRTWEGAEGRERLALVPAKFEMVRGKLLERRGPPHRALARELGVDRATRRTCGARPSILAP